MPMTLPQRTLNRSRILGPSTAVLARLVPRSSLHTRPSALLRCQDRYHAVTKQAQPNGSPISSPYGAAPSPGHLLRLSRSFQTTSLSAARLDSSTIDYAVMPSAAQLDGSGPDASDSFARLRVPLLPDNFAPNRAELDGHGPEVGDAPLAAPEISVIAAHPENVVPAALTEIEGQGADGIDLSFAHGDDAAGARAEEREPGMLTDLWRGLMEDILGPDPSAKPKPAT